MTQSLSDCRPWVERAMQGRESFASPSQIGFWVKELYEAETRQESPWIDPSRVSRALVKMLSEGLVERRAGKATYGHTWRMK